MGHDGNVIQELTTDHRRDEALFAQAAPHAPDAPADPVRHPVAE